MIGRQEPPPISENWSWQLDAACRGMPSAQFFHPWNERGSDRENRIQQAKQICAGCPVIDSCRGPRPPGAGDVRDLGRDCPRTSGWCCSTVIGAGPRVDDRCADFPRRATGRADALA